MIIYDHLCTFLRKSGANSYNFAYEREQRRRESEREREMESPFSKQQEERSAGEKVYCDGAAVLRDMLVIAPAVSFITLNYLES